MKSFAALALTILSLTAFAAPIPKAIRARYHEVGEAISARNTDAFNSFFAPDFVSIDPKGESTPRDKFIEMVDGILKDATAVKHSEKLLSATKAKDGVIGIKFDFHLRTKSDKGTMILHEVGTDYWKEIDGKWLFVRTVDTKMAVKGPK